MTIYHNEHGYYVIVGIGNYVYMPDDKDTILDWINDYIVPINVIEIT
jgi:hypothetical protein